ncbi:hypothetical protein VSR01_09625 [Actinacidiphila sp. DG2A-62]|uniref:hypothetical protein n=1 Tax=Actinacidiphila sp. DG2A-62 TaxID=3108821 RepID=UPI002DBCA421|nr:hypothetical protein [Actinacidiphila sp. DG2A-62]MEC3993785.1 hypothetical protein [Actinacidiphila sp. DG2A-62]
MVLLVFQPCGDVVLMRREEVVEGADGLLAEIVGGFLVEHVRGREPLPHGGFQLHVLVPAQRMEILGGALQDLPQVEFVVEPRLDRGIELRAVVVVGVGGPVVVTVPTGLDVAPGVRLLQVAEPVLVHHLLVDVGEFGGQAVLGALVEGPQVLVLVIAERLVQPLLQIGIAELPELGMPDPTAQGVEHPADGLLPVARELRLRASCCHLRIGGLQYLLEGPAKVVLELLTEPGELLPPNSSVSVDDRPDSLSVSVSVDDHPESLSVSVSVDDHPDSLSVSVSVDDHPDSSPPNSGRGGPQQARPPPGATGGTW